MRLGAFFIAALCTGQAMAGPVEMRLEGRAITAGDLSASAPRRNEIIAQIAPGHAWLELRSDQQRRLLDNFFPGAVLDLRHNGSVRFVAGAGGRQVAGSAPCYMTRRAVQQGETISAEDLVETPCDGGIDRAKLLYNRKMQAPYAGADLPAFSYVGSLRVPLVDPVEPGTALTLRTVSGPVTIERTAVALQHGRRGGRIFVRTDDGAVFASRLEGEAHSRGEK